MNKTVIFWHLLEKFNLQGGETGLSAVEQQVYAGMRFPRRRTEWLAGRTVAKALLQGTRPEMKTPAAAGIEIGNKPGGAPFYRVNGEELSASLSISHRSGGALSALCFEPGLAVGADLEEVETRQEGFIEDYFTSREVRMVKASPEDQQAFWIALVWSAKESALKALEVGLRMDTRRVEISLDRETPADKRGWSPFNITVSDRDTLHWRGWWQRRGSHVLTLAAKLEYPRPSTIELVEVTGRLPG